jgi:hypothetical protein
VCSWYEKKFIFSLGKYTTVFQADVYTIKVCAEENLDWGYRNRNTCIFSDSEAAIKMLDNCQIISKLVWNCHQLLVKLAQLIWVLADRGTKRNETVDQLARLESEGSFIGLKHVKGFLQGPEELWNY